MDKFEPGGIENYHLKGPRPANRRRPILLGTVAIRTPSMSLQWDAVRTEVPNYPVAEKYLRQTYRIG